MGVNFCPNMNQALAFLLSRNFNFDEASTLFENYKNLLENNAIDPFKVQNCNKIFHYLVSPILIYPGTFDRKNNSQILIFNAKLYSSYPRLLLILQYIIEKISLSKEFLFTDGTISLIINLSDVQGKNIVTESIRMISELLQHYFPIRLVKIFVINAPWYAQWAPSVIIPTMCKRGILSTEIIVCQNITDYIDQYEIPKDLGGKLNYKHKEWIQDELKNFGNEDSLNSINKMDPDNQSVIESVFNHTDDVSIKTIDIVNSDDIV
ncbi:Tyrosine-protein phosphatase non-receptor type 9 [Lobulomyces angularis]|nr:Tyrosine-protein phosphatase non-receptor type 9 [Lobulomyces angularis]